MSGPGHTDPNLWIVHYSMSDPQNRIPAAQVPPQREMMQVLQARSQLEAAGQLLRKEFMLNDRQNWPKVEFTRGAPGQPAYYNPMQANRFPNQPPPNKRPRQSVTQPRQPAPSAIAADTLLEEEENSTQDFFDFLTPREISLSRYKQHHEWMEEIFSSPHAVGQILPIDLGLGLMGELAPLTTGLLDAPAGDHPPLDIEHSNKTYAVQSYHKLTAEQLKDFEQRVSEYTKNENAELEKMRTNHTKKMANLKRSRTYIRAERRLREAALGEPHDKDGANAVEEIVNELEKTVGATFDTRKSVVCVDKGGFVEEQQAPPQPIQQMNGNGSAPSNTDTGSNGLMDAINADNTAESLLDQYGTGSLAGTPGKLSVPAISQSQSQFQSAVATPSAPVAEPAQGSNLRDQANLEADSSGNDLLDIDVEMSGMTNTDDKGGDAGWVMVDQAGNAEQSANTLQPTGGAIAGGASLANSGADADATVGLFDTADFGSFDNLDTAGDALADYSTVDDHMGLDLVDDSAFGDAFHGTEMHHGETGDGDDA
jgi:hypothetical protein